VILRSILKGKVFMKKIFLLVIVTLVMCQLTFAQSYSTTDFRDSVIIHLWKGTPPFLQKKGPEKKMPDKGDDIIRLTNVSDPMMTIYQSGSSHNTGKAKPAVLICPGGGYQILAMNLEGTEMAHWLGSLDITPVVLKYRVPENRMGAYADAQRALSILRSRAGEFNIDPDKIGIMGFSAGGHLSARVSTHSKKRVYEPVDQNDQASMNPDFGILIYPAYLVNKKKDTLHKEVQVGEDTPPMFLVQTEDDPIGYRNSLFFYNALSQHEVSSEIHLFPHGGHGYGLRVDASNPLSEWPELCEQWLKSIHVIN